MFFAQKKKYILGTALFFFLIITSYFCWYFFSDRGIALLQRYEKRIEELEKKIEDMKNEQDELKEHITRYEKDEEKIIEAKKQLLYLEKNEKIIPLL